MRVKAVLRLAPLARPAVAAHSTPVENDKITGRNVGHARADGLDDARRLVSEQEGELVVDSTFAVVEVGVADAAGLNGDDGLARTGIWDDDGFERDCLALGLGNNSAYFLTHGADGSAARSVESERQLICRRCTAGDSCCFWSPLG